MPISDIPLLAPAAPARPPVDLHAMLAPLATQLLGRESLTAVINDPQRATRTDLVLRALGDLLPGAACPRLRILVATGTHRFQPRARADFECALAGRTSLPIESITWHDSRSEDLQWVSRAGTWQANPLLLADSSPLLAIGSVEPHYFAGLSGAHKTVTVGCADYAAIQTNHAAALSPASQPFALAGNPVFDGIAEMLAQLRGFRPVLAVNLLQIGDAILAAAVGEPLTALYQLAPLVRDTFARTLPAQADALILEVTGPLGVSFYQADKALKNAEQAIRDGGLLILQAPCPEGIGQDHFVSLLRQAPTHQAARDIVLAKGYHLGDHKAVRLRHLTDPAARGVRVAVVSDGLSAQHCRLLGFAKSPTIQHALAHHGLTPGRHRIYRVADAGNTVVLLDDCRLPIADLTSPKRQRGAMANTQAHRAGRAFLPATL